MNNDALRALATDELTRQFHEFRAYTFDSSANPKDNRYYSAMYEADRRLIILLGEREHEVYSMADTRMLSYFEASGRGLISGDEPRLFLEFLLEAKRYAVIEHTIDRKLIRIIDENSDLKRHCFSRTDEDQAFFDSVAAFVERTRYRSEIYVAGTAVPVDQLAGCLDNIYYDDLAFFIRRFAWALKASAKTETDRGRSELAAELLNAAEACNAVEKHLGKAGVLLRPHINPHIKNSRSESVYDPGSLKSAKVAQFAHSYLITLRMHNETGEMGTYELLEGINYTEKVAEDPDYEDMIMGLMEALEIWMGDDMSEIEQEVNRVIGRDVWKCQDP